jgi:hypothetical protein
MLHRLLEFIGICRTILKPATVVTAAALALSGCGSDDDDRPDSGERDATGTRPVASAPSAPAPPTDAPGATSGGGQATAPPGGGEEAARTPAEFVFLPGGRVRPATITVPPFIPVEVTLISRDGRSHVLTLDAGRRYEFRVGPGGRATNLVAPLRVGSYALRAVGGGPGATLVVSNEPAGP